MKNKYYVYAYLREDRYTPYYIGKGQGNRVNMKHKYSQVPPEDRRVIIRDNLTEKEALEIEKIFILQWGCQHSGGILENRRERGGVSFITEETKNKISEATKGRVAHNKGKVMSEEQRKKISEATKGRVAHNKGKKASPEVAERLRSMANNMKGRKWGSGKK